MSGMYPNNQDIEIFGEQVSWPGVDASGKFTNGSFSDPMVKPSFIPAETINLILDNLESIISKCGGAPNATGAAQIAGLITPLVLPKAIVMRDEHGRAKAAAPQEGDDIARLDDIAKSKLELTSHADQVDGTGRNLLAVLGVSTIPEAMAELRRRCNNNGEIDNTGIPDFRGIMIGDYVDGLDLSGIAAPTSGSAPQVWNNTYKNNRIVVAGFNTYKGAGETENTKNHVLFTFRNIIARGRMNSSNTNSGGYKSSELRIWLEGASGDGSGAFATGLKAALGGNYLYTVKKCHSRKGSAGEDSYTVWLPTEIEVFGMSVYGDESASGNHSVHFPIYQKSLAYRMKRWNGLRDIQWLHTPLASSAAGFCYVHNSGISGSFANASTAYGLSPAFCVA